jgi:hypothetical protein
MSTLIASEELPSRWEMPAVNPLDEGVWRAWVAKGHEQDQRGIAARMKAVKWVSILALLAGAVLWSDITPYELVVRFIVAGGAIIVLLQAIRVRQYAFALVFGALVLLFNPVAPVFSFSGEWERAVLVASVLPFIASLAWRSPGPAQND